MTGAPVNNPLTIRTASARRSIRRTSRLEAQPRLVVLGLHIPCTDAQLEASLRQEIDGRRLPRHKHWVAEIVVEHIGADAEMRRGLRGADQRRERCEKVGQVIGHRQYRIAKRFKFPRFVHPGGP